MGLRYRDQRRQHRLATSHAKQHEGPTSSQTFARMNLAWYCSPIIVDGLRHVLQLGGAIIRFMGTVLRWPLLFASGVLSLAACGQTEVAATPRPPPTPETSASLVLTPTAPPTPTQTLTGNAAPSPSPIPAPTPTLVPSPTQTLTANTAPSPTPTPTPTPAPTPNLIPSPTLGTVPTPSPTSGPSLLSEACVSTNGAASLTTLTESGPIAQPVVQTTQGETVLYQEDFESGRAEGWGTEDPWDVVQDNQGNWTLRGQGHTWARYTGDAWGDYTLKLRLKLVRGNIHLNYRISGCTRYFIGFSDAGLSLSKTFPCDSHPHLQSAESTHPLGRWYDIEIVGKGSDLSVYVDGELKLSYTDPEPLTFGSIAFETWDDSEAYIDDIVVTGQAPPTLGLHWVKTGGPLGGLGYDVRMRPGSPDVMFVTDNWSGVNMSVDGGRTWYASNEGIITRAGASGDAIPIFSLTVDPHNPDVVWAGTQNNRGIFKSADGGETWAEKTDGVVERNGITFRGFTVDPRNSDIVYAAAEVSSFAWAGENRMGREFDLTRGVVYKTIDGGENWQAIWRGDNLARYIWINPDDPDVIFVSTGIFDLEAANSDHVRNEPGGVGILKSTDGGQTWKSLGRENGLKNLYLGSLFMHPEDPDILLAGAGNNAYPAGSGVYLSTDGGDTWQHVLAPGYVVSSVEFATSDSEVAYAAGPGRFWRSEDGGHSWVIVTGGSAAGGIWGPPGVRAGFPIDFQVDPRDQDRIFVNNYGGGNFLSEDGGRTWSDASRGYTGAQLHDIIVDPTDPQRVYVIGRTGPFCSADGGTTWEGLNYKPATFAEWDAVTLDPANPRNILVADEFEGSILRSADGGRTWDLAFPAGRTRGVSDRHGFKAIVYAPSNPRIVYAGMRKGRRTINGGGFYVGPSFGVFKSIDGGKSWLETNHGLETTDKNINAIAVHSREPDIAYVATWRDGIFRTTNGGESWQPINQGLRVLDIRGLAIGPENPEVLYAGAESGGIYKSIDSGASWQQSISGMDPQASIRDIVVDPTSSQIVYAADLRTGVYRSDDGGGLWIRINEGLRTRAVKALAISSDGSTLYAATEGEGVFRMDLREPQG